MTTLSPTNVWAVGGDSSGDLIEHFDGTNWSVVQSPATTSTKATLTGISALSPTDIFAVGSSKNTGTQVLHFDGTTWSALPNLPVGVANRGIDATSDTNIWVVGNSGVTSGIWNFNGTTWSHVPSAGGDLASISGASANDLFAVGETISTTDQPLVERWNGSTWNVVTSANPSTGANSFSGVTTLSNGTVVAVGTVGIETNATTASPAFLGSGTVANDFVVTPATSATQVTSGPVSPDGSSALPETRPVQVPGGDALDVLPSALHRRSQINLG